MKAQTVNQKQEVNLREALDEICGFLQEDQTRKVKMVSLISLAEARWVRDGEDFLGAYGVEEDKTGNIVKVMILPGHVEILMPQRANLHSSLSKKGEKNEIQQRRNG